MVGGPLETVGPVAVRVYAALTGASFRPRRSMAMVAGDAGAARAAPARNIEPRSRHQANAAALSWREASLQASSDANRAAIEGQRGVDGLDDADVHESPATAQPNRRAGTTEARWTSSWTMPPLSAA